MSSSKRSSNNSLKYRSSDVFQNKGGTRPTPLHQSTSLIILNMIVCLCKKSLLFDPRLKAVIYLGTLFFGSILTDIFPVPKTYFSKSSNFLNVYFVKWSWAWLLATTVPWVSITAYTIGCGKRIILFRHLGRLLVATCIWIIWMNIFHYIEVNNGRCIGSKDARDPSLQEKSKCLQSGHFWSSLDISGHSFIIIYSSLILSEEAYTLIGWERIIEYTVEEQYIRRTPFEKSMGYLRYLTDEELEFLKVTWKNLTPYLRLLFIAMTVQQLVSEVMLAATVLYFHIMIEKFMGGVAAILSWYATYRWLFKLSIIGLFGPGDGMFKYNSVKDKFQDNGLRSKRNNLMKIN